MSGVLNLRGGRRRGLRRWVATVLLCLFTLALAPYPAAVAAEGAESGTKALTLEEAVRMALAASQEVSLAKDSVELAELARDEAWEAYVESLVYLGDGMYASLPRGMDPAPAYYRADYEYRAALKDYEVKVASIEAEVYKKYSAVLSAQKQAEVAALKVAAREREVLESQARFRYGMEGRLSLLEKRNALAAARAELTQAEDALDKAYADLAELLGLRRGSRPELVSTVDFVPLEVADVEAEIERIIDESPQVWKARESLKLQERIYGMVNSYDVDRINRRMAERAVDMTEQQLYLALLGAYNSVKALEENLATLQESLALAREGLEVARLKYDLGMSTQAEVLSVETSVASLEAQLEDLKWQHAMAKRAFYEPWAWSGSFGSTP